MRRLLPALLGSLLILLVGLVFLNRSKNASAATATHLVISEVQISGASPSADFIEIYNPTSLSINLGNFSIVKRTGSGSTDTSIVNFSSSDIIQAHSFLLWCFTDISSNLGCDKHSGDTLSNNNSIAIRSGALNTGAIIDSVTIGVPLHPLGEGNIPATPSANQSIERKANSTSTALTMAVGGLDEFTGNGEDTDNNSSDFALRTLPQPQNSQSAIEPPAVTPTPTLTPTETPTPTLSPTPSEEPTPTPSVSPNPTETPTPTPSPSPSPTPSPTLEPTATPTIAPTLTPTVSPTPTLTPTPTGQIIVNTPHLVCTLNYKIISILNFHISIPVIKCMKI